MGYFIITIGIISQSYKFESKYERVNTIIGFINEIKVDFITHAYPYILPPITEEGITYLSLQEIAAMKLNAIVNSGKRLKDFIDIYFLLEYFCLEEMIGFYQQKYPNMSPMIPLKALNYFDDIDPEIDFPKLKEPLPITTIKKRIDNAILKTRMKF